MSLYLHPSITPEVVAQAATTGTITGIKSYPAGVTTNSSAGVLTYEPFYPLFSAMQQHNLILNLHGEVPGTAHNDITILNAEEAFLPQLKTLHAEFPRLRIVLEHCTTAAAIKAVEECGPTVAATITAHHLFLIVDDWASDPHSFCKPVAKTPQDRKALLKTVVSGNKKFFLGTDSAPHPAVNKRGDKVAAGVFTQPHAVGYVLSALEQAVERGVIDAQDVTKEKLEGFLGGNGRAFYRVEDDKKERVVLRKDKVTVEKLLKNDDGSVEVVPFRRDQKTWSVEWK
jgi:dihydroorotase